MNPSNIESTTVKGSALEKGQVIKLLNMHFYVVITAPTKTTAGKANLIKGISKSLQPNLQLSFEQEYAVTKLNKQEIIARFKPKPNIIKSQVTTANSTLREHGQQLQEEPSGDNIPTNPVNTPENPELGANGDDGNSGTDDNNDPSTSVVTTETGPDSANVPTSDGAPNTGKPSAMDLLNKAGAATTK